MLVYTILHEHTHTHTDNPYRQYILYLSCVLVIIVVEDDMLTVEGVAT